MYSLSPDICIHFCIMVQIKYITGEFRIRLVDGKTK